MSVAVTAVPTVRHVRALLREGRQRHHSKSLGDFLTDLYILAFLFGMYGYALVNAVHGYLGTPAGGHAEPGERYWIGIAALLAGVGLAWQALRAVGPLLVTPAAYTWCAATPIDRRGWLMPRFGALLVGGAAVTAVLSLAADGVGARASLGWVALAGGAYGTAAAALAVAAQAPPAGGAPLNGAPPNGAPLNGAPLNGAPPNGAPAGGVRPARPRRWPAALGGIMIGLGVAAVGAVIVAHDSHLRLIRPAVPLGAGLAAVGLPLAAVTSTLAARRLHLLDRAALTGGAQLATAAVTAAVWLDPTMLSGVLEVRRWRRIGRVRSWRLLPGGRVWVLVQAEVRRQARHPSALAIWAALALTQYAVWLAVPSVAGAVHLVGAYLAADRLAGGLRSICRSPGLRRALGGDETTVRLAHVVVPAIGTGLWWLVTWPAAGAHPGWVEVALVAAAVAAAYRAATRPPMAYGGTTIDTPFGLIPVDLLRRLARGPDLLAVAIIVQSLLG
jgi:hypothetical protein